MPLTCNSCVRVVAVALCLPVAASIAYGQLFQYDLEGNNSSSFGACVSRVGDIDGDGIDDFIVGSPNDGTNGNGAATVYSGLTGSVIVHLKGADFSFFGSAVDGRLDLDGDGYNDILVGAASEGSVLAYSPHLGTKLYKLTGPSGSYFGDSLRSLEADLDGDGIRDFMVSAPLEDPVIGGVTVTDAGAFHVYSSASGTELFVVHGELQDDYLGIGGAAGVDDVDGDGVPDLLLGGEGYDNSSADGVVLVASGASGATIRTHRGQAGTWGQLGFALTGMADMNHDGVADYAAGEPYFAAGLGRAVVFSGADGTQLYEFDGIGGGTETDQDVGYALASGDFNRDGIGDLLIGDPLWAHRKSSLYPWIQLGTVVGFLGCPAWSENYGAGWAGKNGVPGFIALNDPVPGSSLTLQIDNSLGSATPALLLVGFAQASWPTGKDGTILVDPLLYVPLVLPAGGLQLSGSLPNDPALYFFDIDLQAIEIDAFASKGLSFTPGLHLRCGFDLP